jgi:hypothetical protein
VEQRSGGPVEHKPGGAEGRRPSRDLAGLWSMGLVDLRSMAEIVQAWQALGVQACGSRLGRLQGWGQNGDHVGLWSTAWWG